MVKLAPILKSLDGRKKARIELIAGRRARIVVDVEGQRGGEVKNLGDEALTEDDVLSLCEEAGAGARVDSIGSGPVSFPYFDGASAYRVTVEMRGRDVAATFVPKAPSVVAKKPSLPPRGRPTRQELAAIDLAVRKTLKPPRAEPQAQHHAQQHGPQHGHARSQTPAPRAPARASVAPRRAATPRPAAPSQPPRSRPTATALPRQRPVEATRKHSIAGAAQKSATPAKAAGVEAVAWPAEHGSAARLAPLLAEGRRLSASDLHLVAGYAPLLRVAGELVAAPEARPGGDGAAVVLGLVPDALRADLERRGGADFALDVPKLGRFRVNVTLTLRGPKASLRFLPREVPSLSSLGFVDALGSATEHHQGLVVVTGPSGHGKTTTLAALVDHINERSSHHIITVEDPVEIIHTSKAAIVTQREIGAQAKSFARALKGALRQDPDVIVVGELRDTETVRMALSASETGHLVLGTMNTPSAAATIEALIDLFPPGDQPQVRATLAGGLKYIVSQRLVPRADGAGSAVALETLPGSLPLWNMIRDQKTFQLPSLMQRGRGLGIIRLNDSLADLVRQEIVTRAAALSASPAPDELDALLRGAVEAPPVVEKPPAKPEAQATLLERAGAFFRKGD